MLSDLDFLEGRSEDVRAIVTEDPVRDGANYLKILEVSGQITKIDSFELRETEEKETFWG